MWTLIIPLIIPANPGALDHQEFRQEFRTQYECNQALDALVAAQHRLLSPRLADDYWEHDQPPSVGAEWAYDLMLDVGSCVNREPQQPLS